MHVRTTWLAIPHLFSRNFIVVEAFDRDFVSTVGVRSHTWRVCRTRHTLNRCRDSYFDRSSTTTLSGQAVEWGRVQGGTNKANLVLTTTRSQGGIGLELQKTQEKIETNATVVGCTTRYTRSIPRRRRRHTWLSMARSIMATIMGIIQPCLSSPMRPLRLSTSSSRHNGGRLSQLRRPMA